MCAGFVSRISPEKIVFHIVLGLHSTLSEIYLYLITIWCMVWFGMAWHGLVIDMGKCQHGIAMFDLFNCSTFDNDDDADADCRVEGWCTFY